MPDTATTAPSRRVRVVVDTDTGIDDALALVWLATRGDVEIVAVGSTHGNCRADQAAVNALRVLEACGGAPIPVAEGRPGPLSGGATPDWRHLPVASAGRARSTNWCGWAGSIRASWTCSPSVP
jgi:purine nucleosidase